MDCIVSKETHMTRSDLISARNSGTPPVKLLFDKSLIKTFVSIKYATNKLYLLYLVQKFEILTILVDGLDSEWQARCFPLIYLRINS